VTKGELKRMGFWIELLIVFRSAQLEFINSAMHGAKKKLVQHTKERGRERETFFGLTDRTFPNEEKGVLRWRKLHPSLLVRLLPTYPLS
jgi:hypothetical protein